MLLLETKLFNKKELINKLKTMNYYALWFDDDIVLELRMGSFSLYSLYHFDYHTEKYDYLGTPMGIDIGKIIMEGKYKDYELNCIQFD